MRGRPRKDADSDDAESRVGHPAAWCRRMDNLWVQSLREESGLETKI